MASAVIFMLLHEVSNLSHLPIMLIVHDKLLKKCDNKAELFN